jgi:hypothetical protein
MPQAAGLANFSSPSPQRKPTSHSVFLNSPQPIPSVSSMPAFGVVFNLHWHVPLLFDRFLHASV